MIVKKNFLTLILLSCVIAVFTNSCLSDKQKPDDAYDIVKEERMLLDDTNFISVETIQESMQTLPIKSVEKLDEWAKFENEIELKIEMNETLIKELRKNSSSNFFFQSKLRSLENDNNNLRMELARFNENMKLRWATFKTSINHNAAKIEIELNAMNEEK